VSLFQKIVFSSDVVRSLCDITGKKFAGESDIFLEIVVFLGEIIQ